MGKYVIETIQVIKRRYYVEVDDPSWAHDGICMDELEEFSQEFYSEDIIGTQGVEEWPTEDRDNVNGAVMTFNYDTEEWDQSVRWDLAK